ncbi:MAG: AAA family ATPase [Solirubrobacteraceae bacterium]
MRGGLLERDAQIATLERAVERVATGHGSVQLLAGPAGIGKTTLLDVAGDVARERGALVLGARASELDRGFGFGVVHQLLDATVRAADDAERARLFAGAAGRAEPLFGAADAAADPEHAVLSGLYWLITTLAEDRPVVLSVDDLHWADVGSLRLLEFLARRIDDLPVLVAGTVRRNEPGSPTALLAAIEAAPASTAIELSPLSVPAVGRLLEGALDATPDDDFRDAAGRVTGGNPLLLSVLTREATGQGLRGRADEVDRLPELGARGLAPTVVRRLAALEDAATTVAWAAAVVGERGRIEDLIALAGHEPHVVHRALGALAAAGIVRPERWEYVHPLVREAVLESIPAGRRTRLHRLAAERLRERGARPAEVALHRLATEPSGDPDAVDDLRAAARDAAAEGATSTAVELLRRAVDEQAPGADRVGLLAELAEHEVRTLDPAGAVHAREAIDAGVRGADGVRAHAARGTALLLSDPLAALSEIDTARAQARDRGLRLRLDASALEALVFVDALAAPRDDRYRAIRGKPDPSVVELAHLASEEALAGRPADVVVALGLRALSGGTLLREVGPGGSTWNLLSHALRFAERPDLARRTLVDGDRVVRERGLRTAGAFVDQAWGYWHRDFGSAARGLAHAQAAHDGLVDAGVPISLAAVAAIVAENLVLLDRAAEADELMDRPFGAAEETFVEVFALTARGLTRTLSGRHDEAEVDLRRVVAILDARGWRAPWAARGRMRLAELLVARARADAGATASADDPAHAGAGTAVDGRQGPGHESSGATEDVAVAALDADAVAEARELIGHDVAVAEAAGTRGALGAALRVRALTEDGATRLETLRGAERILAGSPLRLEHGRALLDLGIALRRADERAAARDALRGALDIAGPTESAWLARRARDELRASGGRPRRERATGLPSLTSSERRIAELAAEGLTNRQIAEALWVTRKTVEFHLSRAYAKLDIGSRRELATVLGVPTAA